MKNTHFKPGTFFVGCNYWASHAGMRMWSMWDEAVVEDDLQRLAEAKITTLRIFPLWSDFQPLRMHYACNGVPKEIRMGEQPLPHTEAGRAGVDEVMLERFARFCDLAEKYGLKLIVGLLTGWMSGRLFVPEMLLGRNALTDPMAIKWEIKFVRLMVKRFKDHPAIVAWDLGNECNCMGQVENEDQAYTWAATISMAIRCEDPDHPIVSGMHGLNPGGAWRMQDQAEFLDVLCTHPYPLFTPHCDTDPLTGMKSPLHATAESLFYANIGGKPCFAEETGVLGPMVVSDENAAHYIRNVMMNLLAHDCGGMLWWCGFEQTGLSLTPYDWNGVERELGLFYADKTKKPVLKEITRFAEFVEALPFDVLPPRICDAVCILNPNQDVWAAAYGAFLLAKQAGVDLTFAWVDGPIPEARAYLLPDQEGDSSLPRHVQRDLAERVRRGAKLYMSIEGPLMSPFSEITGLRVLYRAHQAQSEKVLLGGAEIPVDSAFTLTCESVGAEVLACTESGRIAFAKHKLGEGEVYTLMYPAEITAATVPGVIDSENARPLYKFYEAMDLRSPEKIARIDSPDVVVTEHIVSETKRYLMIVNAGLEEKLLDVVMPAEWSVTECATPDDGACMVGDKDKIRCNSGACLTLEKA